MKLPGQDIQRILCIRDDARGDILLTTPAVVALRNHYPDADIHYLAKRDPAEVLAGLSFLKRVHHFENLRSLRAYKFDLVIDWRDRNGAIPVESKHIIKAIDNPLMRADTESRKARHRHGRTFAQLYADVIGLELPKDHANVFIIPDGTSQSVDRKLDHLGIKENFITVSFDSCWQTKAYPARQIRELCYQLAEISNVVLLGKINGVVLDHQRVFSLIGKTNIAEAAEVIRRSHLFVGIDSLPLHLADTVGTPSVSIWTATAPETILTDGSRNTPVITSAKCHPCFKVSCKNCRFPEPDEIVETVKRKLTMNGKCYIVMPSYTQSHLTTQSVKTLMDVTERELIDFKLILVNDGGGERHAAVCDTLKILFPEIDVIHKDNGGFVSAVNSGIRHAIAQYNPGDTDFILWLNDDVIIEKSDWLHRLRKASDGFFVTGPQGSLLRDNFAHGGYLQPGSTKTPDYIDGWCLFAPARYYRSDSIGVLDDKITEVNPFGTFSEDADWCIRCRREGIEMRLAPGIGIKHLHHQTFNAMENAKDAHVPSLVYMRQKYRTLKDALNKGVKCDVTKRTGLACPICGKNAEDEVIGEREGFTIVRCRRCGIQRVKEMIDPAELVKHYDDALGIRTRDDWIRNAQRTQNQYWHEFDKYDIGFMERKGRWLDVGCNLGFLLEIAKRHGWRDYGIEVSPVFVKQCVSKGLNVVAGAGINGQFRGPFNMITLLDVIEHDPDPLGMLKRAHELLAKGGILALSTPDHACPLAARQGLKWDHVRPVEHIFHFTTGTICRLMEMAGFAMDRMVETDEWNYPGARLYLCRKAGE